MAGLSSRFFKAGYTQPKYMLEAHGKSLFRHSVESFQRYFATEEFLFIIRDVYGTYDFVTREVTNMGIKSYRIFVLDSETRGQAETVYLALETLRGHEPITIFNIDTFRPGFEYPATIGKLDGYLEVFEGSGDNWSFIKLDKNDHSRVALTTEKNPVSNLCCTGLYYFSDMQVFKNSFIEYASRPQSEWEKAELYVAPLYNLLISRGDSIGYDLIDDNQVIFCGVPQEYLDFKDTKITP
ncbi:MULTISPECIES: glycosyltransferase family 2 protein [unclassified Endozoicomonas]|uniref:glycosyltransferase family 2 protein n=1 Tax=unclassified Endozoicomonas TaxID=2644528 RepID=UPI003BB4A3E1